MRNFLLEKGFEPINGSWTHVGKGITVFLEEDGNYSLGEITTPFHTPANERVFDIFASFLPEDQAIESVERLFQAD